MAKTRDNYTVTGRTVEEVVRSLNFLLQRVADRMDRIEGIRGTASIESDLEMNDNAVKEVGAGADDTDAARLVDLLSEPLTLSELTVHGDSFLTDVEVSGVLTVVDSDDHVIHQFGSSE